MKIVRDLDTTGGAMTAGKDDGTVPTRVAHTRQVWAADFWSRFILLWAVTLAYKQLAFYDVVSWLPIWVRVTVMALIATSLVRPRISTAVPLLCLDIWIVVKNFPDVPNHWALMALVESVVLVGWAAGALAGKTDKWTIETIARAIRYALYLMYALAAFHKLNSDFFEPGVSCAMEMAGPLRVFAGALPAMTVVGELLVPLLLVLPATRLRYGVPLGLGMHTLFALTALPPRGIFEFSIAAMSLYWVFFVGRVAPSDDQTYESSLRRLIPAFPLPPRLGIAVVFVAALAALMISGVQGGKWVSHYLWPAVGLVPMLVWIYGRRIRFQSAVGAGKPSHSGSSALALSTAGLVLLFGVSPYLGFKGVPAFSMFSNLRTESIRWNHYLLPPAIKIFDLEDDTVLIRSDEGGPPGWFDPKPGMLLPYETLICILADRATPRYPDDVRVIRGTRVASSEHIEMVFADGSVRVNGAEVQCPLWKSKLLRFRPQTLSPHRECSW
jgi:hypothetical protein